MTILGRKTDFISHHIKKTNSGLIKHLKVRQETMKVLEENRGNASSS